jgi:hypothetical protein
MTKQEQIRQALGDWSKKHGPIQTILSLVKSVDADNYTCVLDEEGFEIYDVRLRPVINGNESITIIPKVDSWVLASRIEEDEEWMVVAVDEIETVRIVVESMVFEMKDGKFLLKSGNDSLGKCMDDLITQILMIYAPKNAAAIKQVQQRFKQLLND